MDNKDIESIKNILTTSTWEKESYDFQDFHIHQLTEGHILQALADDKKWTLPCLLVSSHIKSEEPHTPPASPSRQNTDTSRLNESLAGSPLKLQEFTTENFITAPGKTSGSKAGRLCVYKPVNINKARCVLSLYCAASDDLLTAFLLREDSDALPPVWVLCDARDRERTVAVGVHATQRQRRKHLRTSHVCVQGPLSQDGKSVSEIWAKRPAFCQNTKSVSTKCSARYTLHGSASSNDTIAPGTHQGALEIHFLWSRLSGLLAAPPVEAKALVKATVVSGDPRSAAHLLYSELVVLQSLVSSLDTGEARWAASTETVPLLTRVKHLVKGLEGGAMFIESSDDRQDDADSSVFLKAANNAFVEQREELDFTEQLWNILKDCTSFRSLVDCFQFVLDCLAKGDLQPVVHRDNSSRLAQLIRDSYVDQMSPPPLEGALPLELLVEIGLEKLQNDYTNAFLSKELVTSDSLERFTQRPSDSVSSETSDALSDVHSTATARLMNLRKLHHSLELIATLETLSLPKMTLSISARQALKHYETTAPAPSHTFTIAVQTSDVKAMTERFHASEWQVELSDHQGGAYCLYKFSERPPFDHVYTTPNTVPDETLAEEKSSYYLTILTEETVVL